MIVNSLHLTLRYKILLTQISSIGDVYISGAVFLLCRSAQIKRINSIFYSIIVLGYKRDILNSKEVVGCSI